MTRSVLVVDDHPSPATSAAHALEAAGYSARVATSVDAALVELADRPDAVVLDHCLDRDASLLRLALVRARVPVVLVSGLDDEAALDVAGAHTWSFLPKPFDDVALVAAVAALFPTETPSMPERPSPDPRPSIVPDLPPSPASIAPREAPLPAPPPAAQLTPSGRPANVPPLVQAIDRVGDIVACVIIGHLCALGKVSGEVAVLAIGAIVGVGTGLRQVGARAGTGAGVGVVGLLLLGFARWLAPAAGAAELARASGIFGLLAVLALGAGCGGGPLVQSPGAALALRVAWPSIHKGAVNGGLCQDDPPEWLVGPTPKDGGAPQPSAPNPSDSSPPALPGPSQPSAPAPRVEGDGGAPNDAPAAGEAGGA